MAGYSATDFSTTARIYRNDGGTFVDIDAGLTGVGHCSLAWGDFDGDGDLDLVVSGRHKDGAVYSLHAALYVNGGGGSFTTSGVSLTPLYYCSLAWGDHDADGDLDLVMSGADAADVRRTYLYTNDGGGGFTASSPFVGINAGSLSWGDHDGDGDLDLAIGGFDPTATPTARIYRNDRLSGFTDISAALTAVSWCSVAWADVDGDGDLDLALAGRKADASRFADVYRNGGSGTFTAMGAGLTAVDACSAAWADVDGDGDLDLVMAGASASGPSITMYRAIGAPPNAWPSQPTDLQADRSGSDVTFSWLAGSDDETPTAGLSYQLRVGTVSGGHQRAPGMWGDGGQRLTPLRGSLQPASAGRHGVTLTLPSGSYWWTVQAIDGGFLGSAVLDEQTVVVP